MRQTLLFFTVLVILAGCNINGTWRNGSIDPQVKADIDRLNKQVIDGFSSRQPEKVLAVCSDQLIAIGRKKLDTLVAEAGSSIHPATFVIRDQFYTKNAFANAATTAVSGDGDHDYKISFQSITKESVLTVGEFRDSNQTIALTTIYGKINDHWKLNVLRLGIIKVLNMDAFDWFRKSRADYQTSNLVDAANEFSISSQLAKPAGEYWYYHDADRIRKFGDTLENAVGRSYSLPVKMVTGQTVVSVIQVSPVILTEGYFPSIGYITTIPFKDTAALSKECDLLHASIDHIFPRINRPGRKLLYRAYQKTPVTGNEESYGFVREVK